MRPTVGFDLSPLCWAFPSGISYYTYYLSAELEKLELPFVPHYFVFSHRPFALDAPAPGANRLKRIPLPMRVTRKVWDFGWGQKLMGLSKLDLFFAAGSELPALSKKQKKVIVMHNDFSAFRLEGFFPRSFVDRRLADFRRGIEEADRVVVVSETARVSLCQLFGFPKEKCAVIPEGVDAEFFGRKAPEKPYPQPYFFSNGMIQPRKNFVALAKAFLTAVAEAGLPHHLLIAGGDGWKAKEIRKEIMSIDPGNRVQFLGHVSHQKLAALYQNAEAFLFPSLCEGFGLPVLEAMAAEAPVLTSNTSALPEVAGDAALLVNPNKVETITAGILRLATDHDLADKLRQRGKNRAREYSFARTARLTARFISDVLGVKEKVCGK